MPDALSQFASAKYLNLETFRKTGAGVQTPVWFAQVPGQPIFYVYSEAHAGKVKRVRNNPKVRMAPCNFRGNITGEWVDAKARICGTEEAHEGQQLLRRKYGLLKIIGDFFGGLLRHKNALLAIELT
jgi:uncharacterized protein